MLAALADLNTAQVHQEQIKDVFQHVHPGIKLHTSHAICKTVITDLTWSHMISHDPLSGTLTLWNSHHILPRCFLSLSFHLLYMKKGLQNLRTHNEVEYHYMHTCTCVHSSRSHYMKSFYVINVIIEGFSPQYTHTHDITSFIWSLRYARSSSLKAVRKCSLLCLSRPYTTDTSRSCHKSNGTLALSLHSEPEEVGS